MFRDWELSVTRSEAFQFQSRAKAWCSVQRSQSHITHCGQQRMGLCLYTAHSKQLDTRTSDYVSTKESLSSRYRWYNKNVKLIFIIFVSARYSHFKLRTCAQGVTIMVHLLPYCLHKFILRISKIIRFMGRTYWAKIIFYLQLLFRTILVCTNN